MLVSLRKTIIPAFTSLLILFLFVSQVSAQEATLIVYVEALGGDTTFPFTGSPSPLRNFEVDTTVGGGGGVQAFNLKKEHTQSPRMHCLQTGL